MLLSLLPAQCASGVPQPLFAVKAVEDGDTFSIHLEGELDLAVRYRLDRAFAESEASDAQWVSVDLDELTFIDASGLDSLLSAAERSVEKDSAGLQMTRGKGDVAAIFQLTALDQILPLGPA